MRAARLIAIAALPACALTLAGCGSSGSGGKAAAPPTPTSTATNAVGCTPPPALQAHPQSYPAEPPLTIAATTYTATIVTNCGTITLALDGKDAPHTVNSFAFLASKGYFNDTACLRLVTSGIHVLQCGDPTETGSGGPGYTLPDENLKGATYAVGTVAMANNGRPHTGGSQFFLIYGPSSQVLSSYDSYTPFGRITSGLDIVRKIAAEGSDNSSPAGGGKPNQPVVIESFTVTKG